MYPDLPSRPAPLCGFSLLRLACVIVGPEADRKTADDTDFDQAKKGTDLFFPFDVFLYLVQEEKIDLSPFLPTSTSILVRW